MCRRLPNKNCKFWLMIFRNSSKLQHIWTLLKSCFLPWKHSSILKSAAKEGQLNAFWLVHNCSKVKMERSTLSNMTINVCMNWETNTERKWTNCLNLTGELSAIWMKSWRTWFEKEPNELFGNDPALYFCIFDIAEVSWMLYQKVCFSGCTYNLYKSWFRFYLFIFIKKHHIFWFRYTNIVTWL
jgi:hypothetical protein